MAGALALVAGGYVARVHWTHPRNESAFLAEIRDGATIDYGDPAPHLPSASVLLAEGQHACDWLNGQPYALWRRATRYTPQAVEQRYITIAMAQPAHWQGLPEVPLVVDAALKHLCPASLELRRPIPGFRGQSD